MTQEQIARLIARRNKLTSNRYPNIPAIDAIDEQLRNIPTGTDNEIDLMLGRRNAVLPDRAAAIVDALERAAEDAGAAAEWLTPAQIARIENAEMTRIAVDAMRNQKPIEY